MTESGETRTLTYDELAAATGLKLASARRLVFRKKWPRTKGNDGLARVTVPVDELPRHHGNQHGSTPAVIAIANNNKAGPAPAVIVTDDSASAEVAIMTSGRESELAKLRERVAEQAGELRGLREALRVAESATAEAQRQAAEATRRAERAERTAVDAWRTAADLAQHLTAIQSASAPIQAPPASAHRQGWLGRLLGIRPAW